MPGYAVGSELLGLTSWINAKSYSSIAAAVAAVPASGGVVYIPEGTYGSTSTPSFSPGLVLPNDRPITLLGAGPEATTLLGGGGSADLMTLTASYQSVERLTLDGQASAPSAMRGIVIGRAGAILTDCRVQQSIIRSTGSWCVHVLGASDIPNTYSLLTKIDGLRARLNQSNGAIKVGDNCTTCSVSNSTIDWFKGFAVLLIGNLSSNFTNTYIGNGDDTQPFFEMVNDRACVLSGLYFEQFALPGGIQPPTHTQRFLRIRDQNRNISVIGCTFDRANGGSPAPNAIQVGQDAFGIVILNPSFRIPTLPPTNPGSDILLSGATSDAIVIGGSVTTPTLSTQMPRITDATTRSMLVGANGRLRLPRFSQSDRDALLLDLLAGDLVYNLTTGRVDMRNSQNTAWVGIEVGAQ